MAYIKLNVGYNFSLIHFEMKLMQKNNIIATSEKIKGILKGTHINVFENISIYLQRGVYEVHFILHITKEIAYLNRYFFPFSVELTIFECVDANTHTTLLLDVYPQNSLPIDASRDFVISLLFWGKSHQNLYVESTNSQKTEVNNVQKEYNGNLETYKMTFKPEEIKALGYNFTLVFPDSVHVYKKMKKYMQFEFYDNTNILNAPVSSENYDIIEKLIRENGINKVGEIIETGKIGSEKKEIVREEPNLYDGFMGADIIPKDYDKHIFEFEEISLTGDTSNEDVEAEECLNPTDIFSFQFNKCLKKRKVLTSFFVCSILFLFFSFFFLTIKILKSWKCYRNYCLVADEEETRNLFVDDDL